MDEILFSMIVDKDVDEILVESGIPLESVDSMIWSHWHFDHHGAPDKFPNKVEIVVGPGFKDLFLPGFPTRPDSILPDIYFKGRHVRELSFEQSDLTVGSFPAIDYFGDGSFYLLDSPGHAIGHMCALARTTTSTFVFLGGDICHNPGIYRPTTAYPLPEVLPVGQLDPGFPQPCPCSLFMQLHPAFPDAEKAKTTPFFQLAAGELSTFLDMKSATQSVSGMREFEESPDVLVCISHDMVLLDILPLLNNQPDADINDWKARGYKESARWFWLNELPRSGKPGRPPFVEGRYLDGQRIETYSGTLPKLE
ncbi:hypothetical protein G7046_g9138 [Stylonectria norvegica]|nr:hypothetical protein G7046_g9138 [Stylonectria norvegica]